MDYYRYAQAEKEDDVRRSGLRADPDGLSADLGQAIDVEITADLDRFIPIQGLRGVQWRTVGGAFDPGEAFAAGNDNAAYRLFSELRVRF